MQMNKSSKIYIAGHNGLVGSAIQRKLESEGYTHLVTRNRKELDLLSQSAVKAFFENENPDYVFLAAAKVGGIHANNTYRAEFIYENLTIQGNIIHHSYLSKVKRLLFLGSSCIYPRACRQPIVETDLLTGPLEPTNSPYAVAKIAGIEMCWSYNSQYRTQFIPVMPTNLYGPKDNFDLNNSHVLPALLRKFHLAKLASQGKWEAIARDEARFGAIPDDIKQSLGANGQTPRVILWGTGTPLREFLHVDDLAQACIYILKLPVEKFYDSESLRSTNGLGATGVRLQNKLPESPLLNVGTGTDIEIRNLAKLAATVVGYDGEVVWDSSKPDGTPRKLLNVSRVKALGWSAGIPLEEGLRRTYAWYLEQTA
jgi:GDP-L-fucose synthase